MNPFKDLINTNGRVIHQETSNRERRKSIVDQSVRVSSTNYGKENLGHVSRKEKESCKRRLFGTKGRTTCKKNTRSLIKQKILEKGRLQSIYEDDSKFSIPLVEPKLLPHETIKEEPALMEIDMGVIEEANYYWLSDKNLEDSQELSFFGNIFKGLFLVGNSNELCLQNLNKERMIKSTPGKVSSYCKKSQKHCDSNLNDIRLVLIVLVNDV